MAKLRYGFLLVGALSVLLLTGCSGHDRVSALATRAPSPSASPADLPTTDPTPSPTGSSASTGSTGSPGGGSPATGQPPPVGTPQPPSPGGADGGTTVRGLAQAAEDQKDCYLLTTTDHRIYLLLGGDRPVIAAGGQLEVVGRAVPGLSTTCHGGIPFQVASVRRI